MWVAERVGSGQRKLPSFITKKDGQRIPLTVQVIVIADVFDALRTTRPLKYVWEVAEAIFSHQVLQRTSNSGGSMPG